MRTYRYLDLIIGLFVTVLLLSNTVGIKPSHLGPIAFSTGLLLLPIDYILGDVLTEVYGYAVSRRVIWIGFVCAAFTSIVAFGADQLPPAPGYADQAAFHTMFGQVPRVILSSMTAYACGEFANSYTLAKMKVWTEGRHLWTRTVGSTVVSELVDSVVVYPLAFAGRWPIELVVKVAVTNYILKVVFEVVATPATYWVVAFLKRREGVDVYDTETNFNPLTLKL